jgi:regulator of cell morphogenesis and NO signaling
MITEQLSLAAIAQESLAAVRVLEEHGIDYCTAAERSLADLCLHMGLNVQEILDELSNVRAGEPEDRDWTSEPLRSLIAHLSQKDHSFFRVELDRLQRRLARVAERHATDYPELLQLIRIFHGLREDLEVHMRHEESDVFPAIERFLSAAESGQPLRGSPLSAFGGPLQMMEREHESAGSALRLMREFARNYSAPGDACPMYQALLAGFIELEDRLLRHMYLENNVLYPRCAELKRVAVS